MHRLRTRELILTAEGNKQLFPLVDAIVAAAPDLLGWQIISLKPPMGFDFQTEYEGIVLDPKQLWFLPLESPSKPLSLGLRVGVPGLDHERKSDTTNAVFVILDTALGERAAADDFDYLEVAELPTCPESEDYIELTELPAYIEWKKRKQLESNPGAE